MVKPKAARSQAALGLVPRVLIHWMLLVLLKYLNYFGDKLKELSQKTVRGERKMSSSL